MPYAVLDSRAGEGNTSFSAKVCMIISDFFGPVLDRSRGCALHQTNTLMKSVLGRIIAQETCGPSPSFGER